MESTLGVSGGSRGLVRRSGGREVASKPPGADVAHHAGLEGGGRLRSESGCRESIHL